MKLYFPFPLKVRELYLYTWECWLCESNGTNCGGLEIHHILGRSKYGKNLDSAFNSSCLCKKCHDRMGHSQNEQGILFQKTMRFLVKQKFQPSDYDYEFIRENARALDLI